MRKFFAPLAVTLVIFLLSWIIIAGSKARPRKMDERITLRKVDPIPYGTAATHELLSKLYPQARIFADRKSPYNWDSIQMDGRGQAVFLLSNQFTADEEELETMIDFVERGNYLFIITRSFSYDAQNIFNFSYSAQLPGNLFGEPEDSLKLRLEPVLFPDPSLYTYPGRKAQSFFYILDTSRTIVLGRTEAGQPNFIRMKAGNGAVFIHTAPLAFSNYFVLHKNNHRYFEQVMSVVPATVKKVLWNEFYLSKPQQQKEPEPNWLRVLMRNESLKWALLTGLAALILYVLLGMRRKQRSIPQLAKPRNDSLDFVKTLGRLYYDKKDHRNLSIKMGTYFLEHVRTRYKLSTQHLDEDMVEKLHRKSGYNKEELQYIVGFIRELDGLKNVSEGQLYQLHRKLELFYQNT